MGILEKVEGRLDGNGYINIHESALIPTRDMKERLFKLIDSIPNRCKAVIEASGRPTRY